MGTSHFQRGFPFVWHRYSFPPSLPTLLLMTPPFLGRFLLSYYGTFDAGIQGHEGPWIQGVGK